MDTLYKGQTKGILSFLMLISLYGKFGLFFDDSILGPAYLLSSVTLLIITGKILYEPRIQIGTIILLLTSFGSYLSGNRDITMCHKKYKYLLILSVVLLMSILFIIKYHFSNGRLLLWYVVADLIRPIISIHGRALRCLIDNIP